MGSRSGCGYLICAPCLRAMKVVHHAGLQRTGTKQCHQRNDVLKGIRLQPPDQVLHAAGFQLEDCRGHRGLQQIERGLVIQRYGINIDKGVTVGAHACIDGLQRPVNDGQGAQTEEVELDQPDGFDIVLVKLADQCTAPLLAVQRREIGQL